MSYKAFISTFLFAFLLFSCQQDQFLTLKGSTWKTLDSKYTLLFTNDSQCVLTYLDQSNVVVVEKYDYTYDNPNIIMETATTRGRDPHVGLIQNGDLFLKGVNQFTYPLEPGTLLLKKQP